MIKLSDGTSVGLPTLAEVTFKVTDKHLDLLHIALDIFRRNVGHYICVALTQAASGRYKRHVSNLKSWIAKSIGKHFCLEDFYRLKVGIELTEEQAKKVRILLLKNMIYRLNSNLILSLMDRR